MRLVRNTDPATSWSAAAEQTDEKRKTIKDIVLEVLHQRRTPMTHDDLIIEINQHWRPVSPSGVRTRVKELVYEGKVEAVPGRMAKSVMGRDALLWRLTSQGS